MIQLTVVHIILLTLAVIIGVVLGWLARGKRSKHEKAVISAGWKDQLDAQRVEHKRLVDQNQSLMEQVGQYKASSKDATNRARELSTALKDAFARRDELQREIKDIRSNLETMLKERQQLENNLENLTEADVSHANSLKEKDDKIFKLSRELDSWHERLPPLIERYRTRDADAKRLQSELDDALETIRQMEAMNDPAQTRVDTGTLADALYASNDADDGKAADDELDSVENDTFYAALNGSALLANARESQADTAATEASGNPPAGDNLQAIKGVGPAIEKTLHELGIFRFSQIAQMSEYDIDRVAQRLKGFRSRIYREDWIGQARELQDRLPDKLN